VAASLHTLRNGARVVCDPIEGFETLALSVVAGRGSRFETRGQNGWAHLLEHMVFKGAGERSARDIVEVIEGRGGHINAATGHERTSFQIRALKGGLPLAMAVVSDLLFRPTMDPDELAREKSVIAQEIAEAADTPDDLVFELAQGRAFGDTALGRPILGTAPTVDAAEVSTLSQFRRLIYAPDRMVISAAGAVDEDELLSEAERWFGGEAAGPEVRAEPATFTGGEDARAARLEQAHLVFGIPAPDARDPDYFALRLFTEALGGGMSSRLFQEAREKQGLAYNIDAYAETYADIGMIGIYAGCAAKDAVKTARLCAQEVRALAEAPTDNELERAKAQLKGGLFMARESALARAEQSGAQVLLFDRLIPPAELAAGIDAVSTRDLRRIGDRALHNRLSARAVLGPKAAAPAAAAFHEALYA
jgi:predicted Zn-dependent peptidase